MLGRQASRKQSEGPGVHDAQTFDLLRHLGLVEAKMGNVERGEYGRGAPTVAVDAFNVLK